MTSSVGAGPPGNSIWFCAHADHRSLAALSVPARGDIYLKLSHGLADIPGRRHRRWRTQRLGRSRISGPCRLRVRLLERLDVIGGAASSAHAFDGVDARLSRYAYLVSLLPARILADLGAQVRLARRRFYAPPTPNPADGGRTGLLIGPPSNFGTVGAAADEDGFAEFYRRCRMVTEPLWPTLTEPLRRRAQARREVLAGAGPNAAAAWGGTDRSADRERDHRGGLVRSGTRGDGHRRADRHLQPAR